MREDEKGPLKTGTATLRCQNNRPRGHINTYLGNCKNQIEDLFV